MYEVCLLNLPFVKRGDLSRLIYIDNYNIQSILPLLLLNIFIAKTTRNKTNEIPAPPSKIMNSLKNRVYAETIFVKIPNICCIIVTPKPIVEINIKTDKLPKNILNAGFSI